jgi:uncharacterized protein YnzC (UPF0291/DUF896 family)
MASWFAELRAKLQKEGGLTKAEKKTRKRLKST